MLKRKQIHIYSPYTTREIKKIYDRVVKHGEIDRNVMVRYIKCGNTEEEIIDFMKSSDYRKYRPFKWTNEIDSTLKANYIIGYTLKELEENIGCSYTAVRQRLIKLGVYQQK